MRTRIIYRYLLADLLAPFFLGLSVFIFILMMSQILRLNELIIVHGVGIWVTIKLVFYLITAFLAISIPIAFLFSVLSLFGRLSADSELIALRASGFSLIQLAAPVIAFAAIISVVCLFLTLHVEAWGAKAYKTQIWKIGRERATIGVKPGAFNDDFFGFVLYAAKVDAKEKKLEDVFIYDESDPSGPLSVVAHQGTLVASADLPSVFLVLEDGTIHSASTGYQSLQKIHFDTYTINLAIDELVKEGVKEKPKRISFGLLKKRIAEAQAKGDVQTARLYRSEYHRKFSVAFASFVFALLGIALGVQPTRSVKSGSFVYTLLFVGAYWTFVIVGRSLVVHGYVHPALGMWMPNILFASFSGYLLYNANRV